MKKADTYQEWKPPFRSRCASCGKVVFKNEQAARRASIKVSERVGMMHYRGKCGHWHLTHAKPVSRAARLKGEQGREIS